MIVKRILVVFLVSFTCLSNYAYPQINIFNEAALTSYNKSGNKEQSFYPDSKVRYINDMKVSLDNRIGEAIRIKSDMSLKFTNDTLIDNKTVSLENFKTSLKSRNMNISVGGIYTAFSEFSLNNAMKGMQLDIGQSGRNSLKFAVGVNVPRWENLWEKDANTGLLRYIWGSSYERELIANMLFMKLNYAGALDDKSYSTEELRPEEIHNGTMEIRLKPYAGLDITSEIGYALSDSDIENAAVDSVNDSAFKSGAGLRKNRISVYAGYSRVGPDYKTGGGFISSDLETMNFELGYELFSNNLIKLFYSQDRDNLDGSKETTINQNNPGASITMKLPLKLTSNTSWSSSSRKAEDGSTDNITNTLGFDISRDFKPAVASLNFQLADIDDKVNDQDSYTIDSFGLNVSGNFVLNTVKLRCSLSESYDVSKYDDGSGQDTNMVHNFSINAALPANFNINSVITVNGNDFREDTTNRDQVSYTLSLLKNFSNDMSLSLSHEQADNEYAESTNDYSEMKTTAKMSYKF